MPALWAASFRHLIRHPAQLALALVGLSLGVATIIAVDIATASSRRAFELSMDAVNGAATHQIVGGPQGIDEQLYVELRTRDLVPGALQPELAPVVEGYVTVGEREMQLIGVDPLASGELGGPGGLDGRGTGRGARGDGKRRDEVAPDGVESGAGPAQRDSGQSDRV